MSHKANTSFFDKKKHWSTRKDNILADYLTAYIPKIATQKRPILIVDAFAGPGTFLDGSLGSPLIACKAIEAAVQRNANLKASCLFIEKSPTLVSQLRNSIAPYPFAIAKEGEFTQQLDEIATRAKTHNVFLYVDPFTVEGLLWDAMNRVFQMISRKVSIELLLNFNVESFARRGLAALKLSVPRVDPLLEDAEDPDSPITEAPSILKLDRIVGGAWWQDILKAPVGFADQIKLIAEKFRSQLHGSFPEVCLHPVKALPHHTVPRYYLVFASRHPDALRLMNDAMIKSRRVLADMAKPTAPTLFETRSEELVPDTSRIQPLVLKHASARQPRQKLIMAVIREAFSDYASAEIRGTIEKLLREGVLISSTGKPRINDETEVWMREPRD